MEWKHNFNLKPYNTFGLSTSASRFGVFRSTEELRVALSEIRKNNEPHLVIGGGSNLLLVHDFQGAVLHNQIKKKEIIEETDQHVIVAVGSGEVWHDFVLWTLENGWSGIENLSLIPGSVGAAPIQNIGAYGVELKSSFISCSAMEIETGIERTFHKDECDFGYRWSVFKGPLKGKYILTEVLFRLNKKPEIHIQYGAIKEELANQGVQGAPSPKEVSKAVIAIRQSKLPDPAKIGNSGSFFKNPVIPIEQFDQLKTLFPDLVGYPGGVGQMKVAAGWLIDQLGWKGYREKNFGVHAKQALVLVNYGGARGVDIAELAHRIQADVQSKFGIELEAEVNFIGPNGPM